MTENAQGISTIFPEAHFSSEASMSFHELGVRADFRPDLDWNKNTTLSLGTIRDGNRTVYVLAAPTIKGARLAALLSSVTKFANDPLDLRGTLDDWNMPRDAAKTRPTDRDQGNVQLLRVHRDDPNIPFMPFVRNYLRPWKEQLEDPKFHLRFIVPRVEFIDIKGFTQEYLAGLRTGKYFLGRFLNTHSYEYAQFFLDHPELSLFPNCQTHQAFAQAERLYFGNTRLPKRDPRRKEMLKMFDVFMQSHSEEEQEELVMQELTQREFRKFADPKNGRVWQQEYRFNSSNVPLFPDIRGLTYSYTQEGNQYVATVSNAYGSCARVTLKPPTKNHTTYSVAKIEYDESGLRTDREENIGRIPVFAWEEVVTPRILRRTDVQRRVLSPEEIKALIGAGQSNIDLLAGRAVIVGIQPTARRNIPARQSLINPATGQSSRPQNIRVAQVGVSLLSKDIQHAIEEDRDGALKRIARRTTKKHIKTTTN